VRHSSGRSHEPTKLAESTRYALSKVAGSLSGEPIITNHLSYQRTERLSHPKFLSKSANLLHTPYTLQKMIKTAIFSAIAYVPLSLFRIPLPRARKCASSLRPLHTPRRTRQPPNRSRTVYIVPQRASAAEEAETALPPPSTTPRLLHAPLRAFSSRRVGMG